MGRAYLQNTRKPMDITHYRESENHVNVGPVSIWDVKEPLRTTSTLAVTILSASIGRSAWRDVLYKAD